VDYSPQTLEEWWNSEHVRQVRVEMMQGRAPKECEVCTHKLLNTDVYRDYFWMLFKHKYDSVWENTDETGYTTLKPVSWDYRFSNLCNFKCRQCGDMLSSQWEAESRLHKRVDVSKAGNAWMRPDVKQEIEQFQSTQVEEEFASAVAEGRVEEVYWVGGEPLMYEQHWRYMQQIIEQGDGPKLYARYNTNLSRIAYKGINLFTDILANIRDWELCASIDGTGAIGEYIRSGLNYTQWLANYQAGLDAQTRPNQMRLDYTITLPGLFDAVNMFKLSKETDSMLLTKVTFTFTPDVSMSPFLLPRHLLDKLIHAILAECTEPTWKQQPFIDVLTNMLSRPTCEEQWPSTWQAGLADAKRKLLQLETIREQPITFAEIIADYPDIVKWWNNIDTDNNIIIRT
jgi:hypothetical protein